MGTRRLLTVVCGAFCGLSVLSTVFAELVAPPQYVPTPSDTGPATFTMLECYMVPVSIADCLHYPHNCPPQTQANTVCEYCEDGAPQTQCAPTRLRFGCETMSNNTVNFDCGRVASARCNSAGNCVFSAWKANGARCKRAWARSTPCP